LALVLSALVVTVFTGCDATSTASSVSEGNGAQTSIVDACALLRPADVAPLLGDSAKQTINSPSKPPDGKLAQTSGCRYEAASKAIHLFARRSPVNDNTTGAIEATRKSVKEVAQGVDPVSVSGVGDTAFWAPYGSDGYWLHAFQGGNLYIYLKMEGFGDSASALDQAKPLVQTALTRLKM
jgi:hypothetical protein